MFCNKCGTEVEDGSRFCPRCGAELPVASRAQAQPQLYTAGNQTAWSQARNRGFAGQAGNTAFAAQTGTMGFSAQAPRENFGKGLLGAVLFSLGGVVIWVILYRIGVVAAIAGIATMYLALLGFNKLGHVEPTKGTVLICILITLVMLVLAMYISAALEIQAAFKESGYTPSLGDIFGYYMPMAMDDSEFRTAVILDYAKGVALSLVYGVIMFIQIGKKK